MTLSSYLWGIRLAAFFALVVFSLVVFNIDPRSSVLFGPVLFYATLFLALSGIFILFLTWIRRKISRQEVFSYLGMSFRQGVLLSFLAIALLALQSFGFLIWWSGLLALSAVLLAELYFLSRN